MPPLHFHWFIYWAAHEWRVGSLCCRLLLATRPHVIHFYSRWWDGHVAMASMKGLWQPAVVTPVDFSRFICFFMFCFCLTTAISGTQRCIFSLTDYKVTGVTWNIDQTAHCCCQRTTVLLCRIASFATLLQLFIKTILTSLLMSSHAIPPNHLYTLPVESLDVITTFCDADIS